MQTLDSLDNKHIVITGGGGFIGSHLTDAFLALNARVTIIDNWCSGSKNNLEHIHSDKLQIIEADATTVPNELLDATPSIVLHFASMAGPPLYQTYPVETYVVNALGCHNWLSWIRDHTPSTRLVYASSSEVYGDPSVTPQPEKYWGNVNPNGARACYDEAKRFGEMVCGVFHRKYKLDARMVRIFNTYGPRMNTIDGRAIPQFIMRGLEGQSLQIHGNGEQTRSFCYISDLVNGIVAFARTNNLDGETINLGNPVEQTINQVAKQIQALLSIESIEYIAKAEDDPSNRKPDITKAKSLIEWEPTVSFDEGLAKTIEYFKSSTAKLSS